MASKEVRSRKNSPSSQERTKYFYVPEEVIEEILAYLPIKDAACLSILSKRFVNSWKLCRDLSFTKEISRKFSKEEFNWVHKAIQCGITELELDFTVAEQTYMLSFFLTNIENLKLLKLNKCELDFIPTPDGSCPLLQITLQNVRVPSFTLEAIFSNCLKLRTLELTNCEFLYNLKILAQDLKGFTVLVVKNCTWSSVNED
ncbi:putative FBD-associated F-box protein At1g61330 [Primulina eburnea]|uniref:putative FBD-associated F-box protein At1g61330 n=1 Tax=Primulina eburnea TaxID=1245227 RepID=UPI003C6BE2BE